MPDRENVIKGLEAHGCGKSMWRICNKCPYNKEEYIKDRCRDNLLTDAYALLKEQEAVEPVLIREGRNKNYNDYVCSRCDNEVVYEQNYCSECGVRFLWNEGKKEG